MNANEEDPLNYIIIIYNKTQYRIVSDRIGTELAKYAYIQNKYEEMRERESFYVKINCPLKPYHYYSSSIGYKCLFLLFKHFVMLFWNDGKYAHFWGFTLFIFE